MKVRLALATILITLLSCKDNIQITQQRIFFEVYYINYAWGYTNQGILIDSLGNVYNYDLNESQINDWKSAGEDGYISKADMNKNFALCNDIVHQISTDSLQYYVNKIDGAAGGKLSVPVAVMADAGIKQYIAYIYDKKKTSYKKILLSQWGDMQCTNSSSEASELSAWLKKMEQFKNRPAAQ